MNLRKGMFEVAWDITLYRAHFYFHRWNSTFFLTRIKNEHSWIFEDLMNCQRAFMYIGAIISTELRCYCMNFTSIVFTHCNGAYSAIAHHPLCVSPSRINTVFKEMSSVSSCSGLYSSFILTKKKEENSTWIVFQHTFHIHCSELIDVLCWGCTLDFFLFFPMTWAHVVLQAPGSLTRKNSSTLSLKQHTAMHCVK